MISTCVPIVRAVTANSLRFAGLAIPTSIVSDFAPKFFKDLTLFTERELKIASVIGSVYAFTALSSFTALSFKVALVVYAVSFIALKLLGNRLPEFLTEFMRYGTESTLAASIHPLVLGVYLALSINELAESEEKKTLP